MPTRELFPPERRRTMFLQLVLAGSLLLMALVLFPLVSKFRNGGDEFTRLTNAGKIQYDRGETAKAIATFEQARALHPTQPDALLNLANAHLLANQPETTVKLAAEALLLDHNSAAAHYLMGCAYLRLDRATNALQSLQQAQAIDPAVTALNFQLSLAHERLGNAPDALAQLQTTVEFEPDHPAAHYRLSQLLLRAGNVEDAAKALERHRQVLATKPARAGDPGAYERCKHTQIRLPFQSEQPVARGVSVVFTDATGAAFGGAAGGYRGPVGVIDFNHDGRNSLFTREDDGFRLLQNSNGVFHPLGAPLPAITNARYHRVLVGDLQNDGFEDVVVLGEQGSHVFKILTNATITEVSKFAGLKDEAVADGALADLDFTGKLELLTLSPDGARAKFFRNFGSFFFKDYTPTSGLPAIVTGARQIVLDDWNDDDLTDAIVTRTWQPPLLMLKQRGGPLAVTNTPADWPAGDVLVTGDLNHDQRTDLVIATAANLVCVFNGLKDQLTLPLGGFKVTSLALVDYDNDGWLDIVAAGDGVRVWRNLGRAGFRDATAGLGLDKFAPGKVVSVSAADFDCDGDTDLIVASETQGLKLLRNDGGNANRQIKLRLIGTRSNVSGLGVRIDFSAGGLRTSRTVRQLPVEIGIGQHTQLDSLNLHWTDLSINVEVKADPCVAFAVMEIQQPTGSCPYLYAWDGKRFRFVTDLLGASPLGLPLNDIRRIEADPVEHVWIGDETTFQPRGGNYVLQVTEELREVLYLDEAKLIVVDHPPGTEVHSTSKLRPGKPFPPSELVTLHQRQPLRRAVNHEGAAVTAALAETDGQMVSPTKLRVPQLRGLAEPYSVTLDFGPLAVERPLVLALTGWLRFGGGMANVAAAHHPDLPFPFPLLEVETASGEWTKVDVTAGAPAGKTKTILVDLVGKLPPGSRRLRLSTAFEFHWDRAALFEKRNNSETKITTLAPTATDLHWRGFSGFADLPWSQPLTPVYEGATPNPHWRITPGGWCTRYGEVAELIAAQDNALVLLNGGDELTLSFSADQLPPKPPGVTREFFFYSVGWDKDSDFHVAAGTTVEPLPWHGMDDQLYGHQPRPTFTNDAWMHKFNTRWVGQKILTRRQ